MVAYYPGIILIFLGIIFGFGIAIYYTLQVSNIDRDSFANADGLDDIEKPINRAVNVDTANLPEHIKTLKEISEMISNGAIEFLFSEYRYMGVFICGFSLIIFFVIGGIDTWARGLFTALAFIIGCVTSIVSGYIGMKIAVLANSRVAVSAINGFDEAFNVAFKAGCVMGFALTSLGVLMLFIVVELFALEFNHALKVGPTTMFGVEATQHMYEAVAGYGLGGSSIALFGRVGGGIFTKAADVGADLAGKIEAEIPEDDPRNPAGIADNVGDNVGDIAGMGSDLFGSFAESSCAAMVLSAQSPDLYTSKIAMALPMIVISVGILICFVTSFFATHIMKITRENEIERTLKYQLFISTILATPTLFLTVFFILPSTFDIADKTGVHNWQVYLCVMCGLWSGLIIGVITEYYTSHSYSPVREVSKSCSTGAATNVIYGLSLGYISVIIPVFCLAITIYVSYSFAGMYGIAMAAIGILSTMATGLSIDAYGPISDNAGGLAEMSELGEGVREITDALDAAGNTTAAVGKGFAIASAALVSLALFGAFVTTAGLEDVDILKPFEFSGLLVGAMIPYWFTGMTMKSVGVAAAAMVVEVRRQFIENPKILTGEQKPDSNACVAIATKASLREMIPPGALVMLTPLIVGFLFGVDCLAGIIAGAMVSGVQMAISQSNTGGAWDNAKKFVENGGLGRMLNNPEIKKGTPWHEAAVIGDTVGDPLKDTSGPAINIVMKLMAIISLVFASAFPQSKDGGYLKQLFLQK